MPLYTYVKKQKSSPRRIISAISICCIFFGISLLVWVLYPILAFEIVYASKFDMLVSPVPQETLTSTLATGFSRVLGSDTTDYTNASIWFPKALNIKLASSNASYALSIPKLGVKDANVIVGAEDLNKSLIHFTGPTPGNYGTPVIFGHSTIPWLYNPKEYTSVFSKLPDLDRGDEIVVTADHITYTYRVVNQRIVMPNDLSVLQQHYDDSYITLITCVPPGTYLKRLVVTGKLSKI